MEKDPSSNREPVKYDQPVQDLMRKEVLERITIPNELNIPFMTVTYRKNMMRIAAAIFVLFVLGWAFFGSIPVLIEGRGVVMNRKGLFSLEAQSSGIIEKILISPGQTIQKGQLLMQLSDPDLENQYAASLKKIKALEDDVDKLKQQIQIELQAEKRSLELQIIDTKTTIQELENSIPRLEKELQTKEGLFKQHLLGLHQIYEARQTLSQQKIELETAKGTLLTLEANLLKSYRQQELIGKESDLLQAKQESDLLKTRLKLLNIFSSNDGVVLEILGNRGDHIPQGTPLIRLEYGPANQLTYIIYAYIPETSGKKVQNETPVKIELSNVSAEEYGAMVGDVIQISAYPVSREYIGKTIQNEGLVDYLMDSNKTVVQLIIAPELDPTTPSGYIWTSGKGPPIKITTGTVCIVKGLVTRETPIFYIISLWRLEKLHAELENYLKTKWNLSL